MDRSLHRAKRLLEVFDDLERVRRVRLVEAEREASACRAEQEAILSSISESGPFAGLFLDLVSKRLSVLVRAAQKIDDKVERTQKMYRETATQQKQATRYYETARRDCELMIENASLLEVIEHMLTQALGKSVSTNSGTDPAIERPSKEDAQQDTHEA